MEFTVKASSNQGDNAIKEKKLFSLTANINDRIPYAQNLHVYLKTPRPALRYQPTQQKRTKNNTFLSRYPSKFPSLMPR